MNQPSSKERRLIVIFLVGVLLLNFPLLTLFSQEWVIGGIPVLYLYLFISWGALIGLMAKVIERRK